MRRPSGTWTRPLRDDPMRGQLLERFALEQDIAIGRCEDAGNGPESRALAGAVRADQGHDLVLAEAQRDAAQRMDLAVVDMQVADVERGIAAADGGLLVALVGSPDPPLSCRFRVVPR